MTRAEAVGVRVSGAVAFQRKIDAEAFTREARARAETLAAGLVINAWLTALAGAATGAEAMSAGGDPKLRVPYVTARRIPPWAGIDGGVARNRTNLFTALIACADLPGYRQTIGVALTAAAERALLANAAHHAERSTREAFAGSNFLQRSTARSRRLAAHPARARARNGLYGAALEAIRARCSVLAFARAVGVEIAHSGSEADEPGARIALLGAVWTGRVVLARSGSPRVRAIGARGCRCAVAELAAVEVRAAWPLALLSHADEARSIITLRVAATRNEAAARSAAEALGARAGAALKPIRTVRVTHADRAALTGITPRA